LPAGFVYLRAVAPAIQQHMRYAGVNNFLGRRAPGYHAGECVLLKDAALALKRAQDDAAAQGFALKVYDCYRPERAVRAFVAWANAPEDGLTRHFYPRLGKPELLSGYIASRSGHSQGNTVDLTLVPLGSAIPPADDRKSPCTAPQGQRASDNSVDMGTAFDCFDPLAHTDSPQIDAAQRGFRLRLKAIMEAVGFRNYRREWWHYSYPDRGLGSYDFVIEAMAK
jgi:D-alanyl-D-alanine dipeptidase